MRETIKTFSGVILGYLDTDSSGDVTAKDFGGRILGYYRRSRNATTDFYGKTLFFGNCVVALILKNANCI